MFAPDLSDDGASDRQGVHGCHGRGVWRRLPGMSRSARAVVKPVTKGPSAVMKRVAILCGVFGKATVCVVTVRLLLAACVVLAALSTGCI